MVKKSKTDMKSDVRVHYNSSKPAEVKALAYILQGTSIYVAPGQDRHCLMKPGMWCSRHRKG